MSDLLTAQELKDRIINNDNRCTAQPCLLLLRETRKVSCDPDFNYDGVEYVEQVSGDYRAFETMNNAVDWLNEDLEEDEEQYTENDVIKWHYQNIDNTVNVFLTDKGYQEHLDINKHNLRNYHSYGIHAFRNREIKSLLSLIDENIKLQAELAKKDEIINKIIDRYVEIQLRPLAKRIQK